MIEGIGAAEFPAAEARRASERETERQYHRAELDRLWARGRDVLGCDLAVMGGAMTWVSERNLVAAISNAGGFGVIASGSMSPQLLSTEIELDDGADRAAVRRQSDHLAPAAARINRGMRTASGQPRGARRRSAEQLRGARNQAERRSGLVFRTFPRLCAQAGTHGRRCDCHRRERGGRAYRTGLDRCAGAGDSAASHRRSGFRSRRHWPWGSDAGLSGDGRLRRPARHPLCLCA